jgi:hypothetical protein
MINTRKNNKQGKESRSMTHRKTQQSVYVLEINVINISNKNTQKE